MKTKTKRKKGTLMHYLLTENRFWGFWSADWSRHIVIQWNQKTKFKKIMDYMRLELGEGFGYERALMPNKDRLTPQTYSITFIKQN